MLLLLCFFRCTNRSHIPKGNKKAVKERLDLGLPSNALERWGHGMAPSLMSRGHVRFGLRGEEGGRTGAVLILMFRELPTRIFQKRAPDVKSSRSRRTLKTIACKFCLLVLFGTKLISRPSLAHSTAPREHSLAMLVNNEDVLKETRPRDNGLYDEG